VFCACRALALEPKMIPNSIWGVLAECGNAVISNFVVSSALDGQMYAAVGVFY